MKVTTETACDLLRRTIINCEKIQPKFAIGTSQHTLLKNRIFALRVAIAVLEGKRDAYPISDVKKALPPIESILHKTCKAQSKWAVDSRQYERYVPMIASMQLAQTAIIQVMQSEKDK